MIDGNKLGFWWFLLKLTKFWCVIDTIVYYDVPEGCHVVFRYYNTDYAGDIGPFQVAIALTVITLFFIVPWRENYGIAEENQDSSFLSSITNSLTVGLLKIQ